MKDRFLWEPEASRSKITNKIKKQGDRFDKPISPKEEYYGYLANTEFDETTRTWSLFFEIQTAEWSVNTFKNGRSDIYFRAPRGPASLYHILSTRSEDVLPLFDPADNEPLIEGAWYLVKLVKRDQGAVIGYLYDMNYDLEPANDSLLYGQFELVSAIKVLEPDVDPSSPNRPIEHRIVSNTPASLKVKKGIQKSYNAQGSRLRIRRVVKLAGKAVAVLPVRSIGVMDVGAANCNLLIDSNNQPFAYYDIGYPMYFYIKSLPANVTWNPPHNAAWRGPITQNSAGDLEAVLSHWDWDHWRLARIANMQNLTWIVPQQFYGSASANSFRNSLTNKIQINIASGVAINPRTGYTLYRCRPQGNAPKAVMVNNTGLAMLVNVQQAAPGGRIGAVLMTGDANINSMIIPPPYPDLFAIEAVHHGSNAHGAAAPASIPNPCANYLHTGRIFYSYGINQPSQTYVYGFPVVAAMNAYNGRGWTQACSTAEGINIRIMPNGTNRGNITIGNLTVMPNIPLYANTAFYAFRHSLLF